MNSSFINVEQPKKCPNLNQTQNMEIPNDTTDIIFDKGNFTISWSDIENIEIDIENDLDEIENFFRQDFENDILEDDIFK